MTTGVDLLQIGESLHRRDRQPGDDALPLALIVIDHGHDLDAAVLADARQPLAFRRGANDRQRAADWRHRVRYAPP